MKLAQGDVQQIIGTIAPPAGAPTDLGRFIGLLVNIFITVAGFFVLIYLFSGAFDWIVSGGEKEKLSKAQSKITNAIIGMIMVILALVLFNTIAGNILHIVDTSGGWSFPIPHL